MPPRKTANGADKKSSGIFRRKDIEDFDTKFSRLPYTFDGLVELGRAIQFLKDMRKPDWTPSEEISAEELDAERNDSWSLTKFSEILNREFGLIGSDLQVTRDKLGRHITRRIGSMSFEQRLIEQISSLGLLKNPNTKEAYDLIDFLCIGKEILNWRTGEYKFPLV